MQHSFRWLPFRGRTGGTSDVLPHDGAGLKTAELQDLVDGGTSEGVTERTSDLQSTNAW